MGIRGWRATILALLLLSLCGQARADTPPEGYEEARQYFDGLPSRQRVNMELLLVAGGYLDWFVLPNFSGEIFAAIKKFQASNGFEQTGLIAQDQIERLNRAAAPQLDRWKLRAVNVGSQALWIPDGLNMNVKTGKDGIEFTSQNSSFAYSIQHLRHESARRTYAVMPDVLATKGLKVFYKWISDNGKAFDIGEETDTGRVMYVDGMQNGRDTFVLYTAYSRDEDGLQGERLHILLASMLASMDSDGPWMTEVPWLFEASQSRQATDQSKQGASSGAVITGTGIFITSEGDVLTNAHVVKECKGDIQIRSAVGATTGEVLASDKINDLAVLKTSLKPTQVAKFRANVRLGESVAAFGYPLSDLLATSGNFTLGNITASAGLGDDSRYFQISAPVQPGNSGGPLIDSSGDLIGIVSAKLDALDVMKNETNGDIPQNVNFAIKAAVAQTFLSGNNINVQTGTLGAALQPADLADAAKAIAVFVSCKN